MTIRKGEPWGGSGALLKSSPIVSRDRDLARLIQELRREPRSETDQIEVGLLGGDLHRSLGAPPHSPEDLLSGKGQRLPIDIGIVEFDSKGKTQQWVFVAHLLARVGRLGGIWNGRSAIVMNGSFMGSANLGPRAHPNDGRLDVLDG
ncbi:MAG TPA: hypothetical protein VL068_14750, partial [Microthrixaceae bacterium]|nr:hypothetical protein [Microthrixaceae bacterium]